MSWKKISLSLLWAIFSPTITNNYAPYLSINVSIKLVFWFYEKKKDYEKEQTVSGRLYLTIVSRAHNTESLSDRNGKRNSTIRSLG